MDHIDGLLCAEETLGSPWIRENAELNYTGFLGDHSDDDGLLADFPLQDENAIMCLFDKEVYHMPDTGYVAALQSENVCEARLRAVEWMFKIHHHYNFSPLTITLAVNYLDRYLSKYFLAKRSCKAWMFQLLSVACLSLAAKMEELDVHIIQDFQIEDPEHIFDAKTIQRMELAVLSSLGWRMNSVTALAYVEFLLHRVNIGKRLQRTLLNRITELLLGTLKETAFINYRPSAVALSATSFALEESLPLQAEMHKRTLLQQFPLEKDKLGKCYKLMEELVVDPVCLVVSVSRETSPSSPVTVAQMSQMDANLDNNGRSYFKRLCGRTQSINGSVFVFGSPKVTRKRKVEELP